MRKLASVQEISDIQPILGADRICRYKVVGWWVIDQIGKYNVGDKVIYCEPDSIIPPNLQYKLFYNGQDRDSLNLKGYRLKIQKIRGAYSQGLLINKDEAGIQDLNIDDDVTDALGIIKYEAPDSLSPGGNPKGNFPGFVPKTDETRVQNISTYDDLRDNYIFNVTEKLDGSSFTCYIKDGVFGVCSRNLDLKESDGNSYWKVARDLDLENKIKSAGYDNIAIQGELCGPGVQNNRYNLPSFNLYVFNVFDIANAEYMNIDDSAAVVKKLGLTPVPMLYTDFKLPETSDLLLEFADGKSVVNPITIREGLVLRTADRKISFKAISNRFLLKNND